MGTYSRLQMDARVYSEVFRKNDSSAELDELRSKAKSLNYDIDLTEKPNKLLVSIEDWLKNHRDELGFFVTVDDDFDDEGFVGLVSTEESGKLYEPEKDLMNFCEFLKSKSCVLEGTFWREGETVGDLQRIVISGNEIVSNETAKLIFSDGSEYNA